MRSSLNAGASVVGLDTSKPVVDGLNQGMSHIDDLSDDDIAGMVTCGFSATEPACLAEARHIVICVPTPLSADGGPDLSSVQQAAETVAAHLQPGQVVILESTTYPGTTDTVVRAILESSGLTAGRDFHLAFSPERVDPGNPRFGITNTPKVVGGLTPACTEAAAAFYGRFVGTVVRAKGPREARASMYTPMPCASAATA